MWCVVSPKSTLSCVKLCVVCVRVAVRVRERERGILCPKLGSDPVDNKAAAA